MDIFKAGQAVFVRFNTTKADGTPITLAGTPTVKICRGSDLTGSTTGVTLVVDAGSVTGLHTVAVDPATAAAYLLPGNVFTAQITAGTIDGVSAVGAVVAKFVVERISAGIQFVLSASSVNGGTLTDNGLLTSVDVDAIVAVEADGGSFAGQPRQIATYNKGTGVFTVSPAFDNDPGTVTVTVYPSAPVSTANPPQVDLVDAPNATAIAAFKTGIAGVSVLVTPGTAAGEIDVNAGVVSSAVKKINATTVNGDGGATPWGP